MTEEEVKALLMEDIVEKIDTYAGMDEIFIEFNLDDCPLCINLYKGKEENEYRLNSVKHMNHFCSFCPREGLVCTVLSTHINQLFTRLIESNELRLIWLYRTYRLKKVA